MCYQFKRKNIIYTPKKEVELRTYHNNPTTLSWGMDFPKGLVKHARFENLYTTWKFNSNNRLILEVDSFWEGGKEFYSKQNSQSPIRLGTIYNNSGEFVILTTASYGIIKQYHDRMPIIVNNREDYFFRERVLDIKILNQYLRVA
jgi:putative SOS response-associated peptidase YedK